MQIDRSDSIGNIRSKGFRMVDAGKRNHDYYFLFRFGKQTSVFMKISRGSNYKTYRLPLIKRQATAWRIQILETFAFLDCSLLEEEFVALLKRSDWPIL
jgi:hypothetical protein